MRQLTRLLVAVALSFVGGSAFGQAQVPDSEVYTLYRDSTVMEERVHIATFDSDNGRDYNRENCQIARALFQQQPGVVTIFWCEPGRYRAQ